MNIRDSRDQRGFSPHTFNPLNQRAKQPLEREVGEVWASCLTFPTLLTGMSMSR